MNFLVFVPVIALLVVPGKSQTPIDGLSAGTPIANQSTVLAEESASTSSQLNSTSVVSTLASITLVSGNESITGSSLAPSTVLLVNESTTALLNVTEALAESTTGLMDNVTMVSEALSTGSLGLETASITTQAATELLNISMTSTAGLETSPAIELNVTMEANQTTISSIAENQTLAGNLTAATDMFTSTAFAITGESSTLLLLNISESTTLGMIENATSLNESSTTIGLVENASLSTQLSTEFFNISTVELMANATPAILEPGTTIALEANATTLIPGENATTLIPEANATSILVSTTAQIIEVTGNVTGVELINSTVAITNESTTSALFTESSTLLANFTGIVGLTSTGLFENVTTANESSSTVSITGLTENGTISTELFNAATGLSTLESVGNLTSVELNATTAMESNTTAALEANATTAISGINETSSLAATTMIGLNLTEAVNLTAGTDLLTSTLSIIGANESTTAISESIGNLTSTIALNATTAIESNMTIGMEANTTIVISEGNETSSLAPTTMIGLNLTEAANVTFGSELLTSTISIIGANESVTSTISESNLTSTVSLNATTGVELNVTIALETNTTTGIMLNVTELSTTPLMGNVTGSELISTTGISPVIETGSTASISELISTTGATVQLETGTMSNQTTTQVFLNETTSGLINATESISTVTMIEEGIVTTSLAATTSVSGINATIALESTSVVSPVSNVTSKPSISSNFSCKGLEPGNYGHPTESCTTVFYICVDELVPGYEQVCPAKLYFDAEVKICEMWAHIPACSGKPRPPVVDVNVTGTPRPKLPMLDCSNLTDGDYSDPHAKPRADCSNRFFKCLKQKAFEFFCPLGLYYDHQSNHCLRFRGVFACVGSAMTNETDEFTMGPQLTLPPVDFNCANKSDGYYAKNCSNVYYSCNDGLARELSCPEGLVFDDQSKSCESPFNTFLCTGTHRPSTPRSVTTAGNKTTGITTPSPLDCTNRPDGIYRDPKLNCSRIFYYCAHNNTFENLCPGKLYYDVEFKRCDLWVNVFACSGMRPTTTPVPKLSSTKVTPTVDFDCLKIEEGNYVNPKNNCSKFFYTCANMEAFQQFCPANLYYDADRDLCDEWNHIFACSGNRPPPTVAPSNVTRGSTQKPALDCSTNFDGTYQDPAKNCSNVYYQCVSGYTYRFECPATLFFDLDLNRCETFENVASCSGIKRTPSTRSPPSSPRPVTPKPALDCSILSDGDYSDPANNCSQKYYTCSAGHAVPRSCPHSTYFDSEFDRCDSFSNVPGCSGKKRTTTPAGPSTVRTPRPEYPFDCTKKFDGNYPAGVCMQEFWSCVGGLTFPRQCLPGLVYDEIEDDCEFAFLLRKCDGEQVPTNSTTKP